MVIFFMEGNSVVFVHSNFPPEFPGVVTWPRAIATLPVLADSVLSVFCQPVHSTVRR